MSHVLISAVLFLLSCSRPPSSHSPIFLGSGPLSLEPVRHWEEAVAHQHRDQSHDLRPLLDSSEAQHRRTQGEKKAMFQSASEELCMCVCVWTHSRGCALSRRALETELIEGLYNCASASLFFISGCNRSTQTQRDFCYIWAFQPSRKLFKSPSFFWVDLL